MVKKLSLSKITVFHTLLILVTAFMLCLPMQAFAGTDAPPPESSDAPPPPPSMTKGMVTYGTPLALLSKTFYTVSFLHNPIKSRNIFIMRLSQYGAVSGCAHMQNGKAPKGYKGPAVKGKSKIKYIGSTMEATLDVPVMANSDGDPRYTNYDCEVSHLQSYVDLKFDRNELLERNIKEFAFKLPELDLGTYNIDLTKDRLIFKAKYGEEPETWITLWFFPKRTLKLHVPNAKQDMNVIAKIHEFGRANGLIPLEYLLKDYELPHQAHNYAYFVDHRRTILKQLSLENNNKQIGEITVQKTFYGPEGAKEEDYELPVHASVVLLRNIWE